MHPVACKKKKKSRGGWQRSCRPGYPLSIRIQGKGGGPPIRKLLLTDNNYIHIKVLSPMLHPHQDVVPGHHEYVVNKRQTDDNEDDDVGGNDFLKKEDGDCDRHKK